MIGMLTHDSPVQLRDGLSLVNTSGDKIFNIEIQGTTTDNRTQPPDALNGTLLFGTFAIQNPHNMEIAFWDFTNNRPAFIINEGATLRASVFDRSVMIGKSLGNATVDENYTKCQGFNLIDCDTNLTGADLGVEDDLETKGSIYVNENMNITGNLTVSTVIDNTIYAQLSSSVDQNPGDTNATVITYNTQDAISGLTHSTSVDPGEITVDTAGIYFVSPQPQVGKTTGAAKTDFDMFLQVDRGSGFVDEPNSNVKIVIKDSDITDVIVSVFTISLSGGDKIRMMQRVSSSSVGLGLKNTDPETGPPTIPRTPSIIFTMYRIGGI